MSKVLLIVPMFAFLGEGGCGTAPQGPSPKLTVSGKAVIPGGNPAAGAEVVVWRVDSATRRHAARSRAASSGVFVVSFVDESARYDVEIILRGNFSTPTYRGTRVIPRGETNIGIITLTR